MDRFEMKQPEVLSEKDKFTGLSKTALDQEQERIEHLRMELESRVTEANKDLERISQERFRRGKQKIT